MLLHGLGLDILGLQVVIEVIDGGEQVRGGHAGQRLRELASIAVQRVGLETETPGEHVGFLYVGDPGFVGHVDGLADGPGDEGLTGRHHADVALGSDVALTLATALVGAVEDLSLIHI